MAAGLSTQAAIGTTLATPHGQKLSGLGQVKGLRAPSDRMALKSAFNNGGNAVLLMPLTAGSAPPRITMRAAAKTAYICKDCG